MRKLTIKEEANKIIGSYWGNPFTRKGDIKVAQEEARRFGITTVKLILDELGELRKKCTSPSDIKIINDRITEVSNILTTVERHEFT